MGIHKMQPRRVFGTLPQLDNPEHDHVMELTSPMQGMEQGHQEGVGITPSKQADQLDMESFQLATARILDPRHENPGNNTPLEDPATREKETPLVDEATRNKTVKDFIEDFFAKFPEETQPPKTEANRKRITNDHLTSTQKVYGFLMELVMGVKRLEKHIDNHLKMEQEMLDRGISQEVIDELDKILPLSSLWEAENYSEPIPINQGLLKSNVRAKGNKGSDKRKDKGPGNPGYKGRHPMPGKSSQTTTGTTTFLSIPITKTSCLPSEQRPGSPRPLEMPPLTTLTDPIHPWAGTWGMINPLSPTSMTGIRSSQDVTPSNNPRLMPNYLIPQQPLITYQWVNDGNATGLEEPYAVQSGDTSAGGNVGASVEDVVRAPVLKHTRKLAEWHLDIEEIDPEWWIPISTVREWLAAEIENWKNKLPSGLGGYVDNLTPEDVYYMILEREMSIEDLHDWLKQWAMQAAQNDLSRSISNLAIHELSDEGGHESDLESNKAMNEWNPLDYADGM
ncbi:hypothetical protein RHS01_04183 [Rhizoctonia solani]|uniref:Uncharacterized protein n=1 Tax=Rhizoctonia solani TaxID=456999 RepID=A0A8H7M843_9AGAM|nr:hypothetical protein RHS01_04183 [Rhizoctonia solani]